MVPDRILKEYGIESVTVRDIQPDAWDVLPAPTILAESKDVCDRDGIGPLITKRALKEMLEEGKALKDIFHFKKGKTYMYARASEFREGNGILYFAKGNSSVPFDKTVPAENIPYTLSLAYTGDDIIKIAEGNKNNAGSIFMAINDTAGPEEIAVKYKNKVKTFKENSNTPQNTRHREPFTEANDPAGKLQKIEGIETSSGILCAVPDPDKKSIKVILIDPAGHKRNICNIGCWINQADGKEHIVSSLYYYAGNPMPGISIIHTLE